MKGYQCFVKIILGKGALRRGYKLMEKMGGWNGWRLFRQGIVSVKARLVL